MYDKASPAEKDQRKKHQADNICLTDIGKFDPSSLDAFWYIQVKAAV